jgi:hypothetical protein
VEVWPSGVLGAENWASAGHGFAHHPPPAVLDGRQHHDVTRAHEPADLPLRAKAGELDVGQVEGGSTGRISSGTEPTIRRRL